MVNRRSKHTHQGHRVYTIVGPVRARLNELLIERVTALGGTVGAMEVMPDHVHLFVQVTPDISGTKIVQMVKGYSSRVLRQEFPHLRRLPSLWTRSSDIVKQYIARQTGI
jgi:putative transposase